jgi:hypothetical protein
MRVLVKATFDPSFVAVGVFTCVGCVAILREHKFYACFRRVRSGR